jgi:hypothetical protein
MFAMFASFQILANMANMANMVREIGWHPNTDPPDRTAAMSALIQGD